MSRAEFESVVDAALDEIPEDILAQIENLAVVVDLVEGGFEGADEFTAHWIDPFAPEGDRPLYPEGLPDLISREHP